MSLEFRVDKEALADYWYWINERHRIYLKREAGEPKPWSEDPIFQKWKFCNVFRNLDKESSWLIENVIKPHWDAKPDIMLFNLYLFRAWNWHPTYDTIGWKDEWDPIEVLDEFEDKVIDSGLRYKSKAFENYTSGAYMLRGRQGIPKYVSILMTLTQIWERKEDLITQMNMQGMPTMQGAFEVLMKNRFWGWGQFTTYQVLLDMIESPLLLYPPDIDDWTVFGPGAKRGIKELDPTLHLYPSAMTWYSKQLMGMQHKYLEPHVPRLNLQDIEFTLCELSKYRKIKRTGRGSTKYAGA